MRAGIWITSFVCVFAVTGCATTAGRHEQAGMVIGGVLGGLLGAQADGSRDMRNIAIIAGTMAGTAIGGSIGHSMDEVDRIRASQTLETVRTGVSSAWRNPDTGYEYQVTPTRTYEYADRPCREYTVDAEIGGRSEQIFGTACRQADGSWKVEG